MFYELDIDKCRAAAHALFRVLDEHLWFAEQQGEDWLCGGRHPTIADIACFPYVMLSERRRNLAPALPGDPPLDRPHQGIPGFTPMSGIFGASAALHAAAQRGGDSGV